MSNEPRKATEVLIDLETKVDMLLSLLRSQDLNIKLLSKKLNTLLDKPSKNVATAESVDSTIFTMVPEPTIHVPISSESKIPVETKPQGFRRTSRPETYSGDNAYLDKKTIDPKFPVQIPKAEAIVPKEATEVRSDSKPVSTENIRVNSVPVQQRVVDKNSKSVFLADVEVFNQNGEKITKTRTNGAGKWMAALSPGTYKIVLTKRESLTKEKVDLVQSIIVDGKTSPLDLPMLIFK